MPARGKRKPGARRSHRPAAESVLGNDPFLRGAASRTPTARSADVPSVPEVPSGEAERPDAPSPPPAAGSAAVPVAASAPRIETAAAPAPEPEPASPAAAAPARAADTVAASSPPATDVRARLERLESRVEEAGARAASRLADLARRQSSGQQFLDLLRTVAGLLPSIRDRLAGLGALVAGPSQLDAFGMDRALADRAAPLLDFLYRSWWRVDARGVEHVPATGPVIVVANHGGALPWDALVLRLALLRDHPARRELRPLLDEDALRTYFAGTAAVRLGAVAAAPANALALLGEGAVVAVFPEGARAAERPWPHRYRIERFGRGGFAKLAFRSGARIVPCAIVGSEETSAAFLRAGWISDLLGLPFLATGPVLPLLPIAFFPLPARWSLRFGEPIDPGGDASAASDPGRVLALAEQVRAALQQMLDEDVAARRSVYL